VRMIGEHSAPERSPNSFRKVPACAWKCGGRMRPEESKGFSEYESGNLRSLVLPTQNDWTPSEIHQRCSLLDLCRSLASLRGAISVLLEFWQSP
jgi:hypothetical protein